ARGLYLADRARHVRAAVAVELVVALAGRIRERRRLARHGGGGQRRERVGAAGERVVAADRLGVGARGRVLREVDVIGGLLSVPGPGRHHLAHLVGRDHAPAAVDAPAGRVRGELTVLFGVERGRVDEAGHAG